MSSYHTVIPADLPLDLPDFAAGRIHLRHRVQIQEVHVFPHLQHNSIRPGCLQQMECLSVSKCRQQTFPLSRLGMASDLNGFHCWLSSFQNQTTGGEDLSCAKASSSIWKMSEKGRLGDSSLQGKESMDFDCVAKKIITINRPKKKHSSPFVRNRRERSFHF